MVSLLIYRCGFNIIADFDFFCRNALIFGAKKWAIYPPHHQIMSNRQILEFFEKDMKDFDARHVSRRRYDSIR